MDYDKMSLGQLLRRLETHGDLGDEREQALAAIDRGWPRVATGGDFVRELLAAAPSLRHVDPARVKDDDYRPPAMLTIPDDERTVEAIIQAHALWADSANADLGECVMSALRALSAARR